ncbi:hypothetical protein MIR68_006484 [Amoeboaphelidium protococcarum]|nr:hypothetical protein MIR68_006484 [Amoeboaphelidium protococcarum]
MSKLQEYQNSLEQFKKNSQTSFNQVESLLQSVNQLQSRLQELEQTVAPLHQVTEKLNLAHESTDRQIDVLQNVMDNINAADKEQAILNGALTVQNVDEYFQSIKRLAQACVFLSKSKIKDADRIIQNQKQLILSANERLGFLYKTSLQSQNGSPEQLSALKQQTSILKQLESDPAIAPLGIQSNFANYAKVIAEVQSVQMHSRLQSSYAQLQQFMKNVEANRSLLVKYSKGSCPFLVYWKDLIYQVTYQYQLIGSLVPDGNTPSTSQQQVLKQKSRKHSSSNLFEQVVATSFDQFLKAADQFQSKLKKSGADFSALYTLLDTTDALCGSYARSMSDQESSGIAGDAEVSWSEVVSAAGKRSQDITAVISQFINSSLQLLQQYQEHLEKHKSSSLYLSGKDKDFMPVDGTVHELTSNSVQVLRRCCSEYGNICEMLASFQFNTVPENQYLLQIVKFYSYLATTANTNNVDPNISRKCLSKFAREALESLCQTVEHQGKYYRPVNAAGVSSSTSLPTSPSDKTILCQIYLINNHHFILKNVKQYMLNTVGDQYLPQIQKIFNADCDNYQMCWKPLLAELVAANSLNVSKQSQGLSKNDRETVKDHFKNITAMIDDGCKLQKGFCISDQELRRSIIASIKSVVMPLYTKFWNKFAADPKLIEAWTSKPEKYVRFPVAEIETLLDSLFIGK